MSKQQKQQEEGPRSFGVFLQEMAEGETEQDISVEMFTLLKKLKEAAIAKDGEVKGELNIKFKFTVPATGPAKIVPVIDHKAPKVVRTPGHFFFTKGGNLTLHNPKQGSLPLREVKGPAEAVEVDHDAIDAREAF